MSRKIRTPDVPGDNPATEPSDDYEVGYRRPPKASQFKPGNQAARKGGGRPKGRKNTATIVKEIVNYRVEVTLPDGRRKKMTVWEASLWKLAAKSANGDSKAWAEFNRIAELYGIAVPAPPPVVDLVTEDEEQAQERFFVGWAILNPERAAALLRELEPLVPPPPIILTAVPVEGRPTVRRVNFALAEGSPPSKRSPGFGSPRQEARS